MKIRFAESTNVPYGQFVVEAETREERALLQTFLWPCSHGEKGWRFTLHGCSWAVDHGSFSGPYSFNFGWAKQPESEGESP